MTIVKEKIYGKRLKVVVSFKKGDDYGRKLLGR